MSLEETTGTCGECGKDFSYLRKTTTGGRFRTNCDMCRKKKDGSSNKRVTLRMTDFDLELLDELMLLMGTNSTEAVRTSIRVYSALLKK